jgi:hypothetical protein
MDSQKREEWETPQLQFKGNVGEILKTASGKLSISGADPGEMRCLKPRSLCR